jgi:16S rRNA (uracil1498-N3)-methyltransferase
MRPHRAYHPQLEPRIVLNPTEAAHLRVLRAEVGDQLTVFDGLGLEAKATVLESGERYVLQLEPVTTSSLEPPQPITLAIALLKADKLADVVRAATELGVARVQLLCTQHSQAKEIGAQKLERLRRIATEAAKQCQRTVIPQVLAPIELADLTAPGLVAHPHSGVLPREAVAWNAPVQVICGPEGGFSSREVDLLEHNGMVRVSLGRRILRAETAALALVSSLTAAEGF